MSDMRRIELRRVGCTADFICSIFAENAVEAMSAMSTTPSINIERVD